MNCGASTLSTGADIPRQGGLLCCKAHSAHPPPSLTQVQSSIHSLHERHLKEAEKRFPEVPRRPLPRADISVGPSGGGC